MNSMSLFLNKDKENDKKLNEFIDFSSKLLDIGLKLLL
jgi:hypothetical protein